MSLLALFICALAAAAANRTVLAIGAHPGDMELTTGALFARYAKVGHLGAKFRFGSWKEDSLPKDQ